ncbi:MAG TPA: MFS transporter [Marmoricola sp.]|nr:MFS transporter [Marmoricola sp.]
MAGLLRRVLPPTPLARRLSVQSVLYAVGEGTFMTGSAVFFTHVVGLTATQVGIGLTVSEAVGFALAVPAGKLADRVGPKRIWAAAALVEAGLYLVYPLVGSFVGFLALLGVMAVVDGGGSSGRSAYTIDAFPREERVRSLAFMRSALNIGFTLGALFGGLALATGSDAVIRAVPLATAGVLALNAVLITRLPEAAHGSTAAPAERKVSRAALRNKGFVALGVCNGVLGTNQALLNVVIPLWLVQETDAPHVLLAWLFGTNTVLAVLFQVPAARGSETVPGALRAVRLCAVSFVACCVLVMFTAETLSWMTIVLIWLGHVAVTGAELFQSASAWGFSSELSDPDRRAEYQGVARLGSQIGSIGGPAAFTWLAVHWGAPGWALIAGIAVFAAAAAHPAARAAERYLADDTAPAAA